MDKGPQSLVPTVAVDGADPKSTGHLMDLLQRDGRWQVCRLGTPAAQHAAAVVLCNVKDWRASLAASQDAAPGAPCILGLPPQALATDTLAALEAGAAHVVPAGTEALCASAACILLARLLEGTRCCATQGDHSLVALPCAMAHVDVEGRVLFWNRAAEVLFAVSQKEAAGNKIDAVLHTRKPIAPLIASDDPAPHGDTALTRATGEELTCCWRAARISQGVWVLMFDDITSRLMAEAELREAIRAADTANRAKSEFLAVMSHEIRTPMNSVIGFTELLLDQDMTERQRDYLEIVRTNGIALLELINNVLEFSRIESGKVCYEPREANLHSVVMGVVDSLWINASRKGIDLFARVSDDVPRQVLVAEGELRRILLNLVSNAIKFTDHGGVRIHVSAVQDKQRCELHFKVADTGIGIPPDKVGHLFKSFSQIDSSSTRRHGGTGLGLAISKRLCDAMGGRMWLESIPGKGSSFYFTLPLIPADSVDLPVASLPPVSSLSVPPRDVELKILVAEDEPMNQLLVKRILSKLGHNCTLANNGAHALERLRESDYNLVLMDVQMPEMDGLQATREIRCGAAGEPNRTVYICALTAYAMVGDQERCITAGMDDYASKPLTINALQLVISRATNHVLAQAD